MKCSVCGKSLQLEESRHTGLCYACRKPSWDHSAIGKNSGPDPFVLIDQLRAALIDQGTLTPEIDARLTAMIVDLSKKKT